MTDQNIDRMRDEKYRTPIEVEHHPLCPCRVEENKGNDWMCRCLEMDVAEDY